MKCFECGLNLETVNLKGRTFSWKQYEVVLTEDMFVKGCPKCEEFGLRGGEQFEEFDEKLEKSLNRAIGG